MYFHSIHRHNFIFNINLPPPKNNASQLAANLCAESNRFPAGSSSRITIAKPFPTMTASVNRSFSQGRSIFKRRITLNNVAYRLRTQNRAMKWLYLLPGRGTATASMLRGTRGYWNTEVPSRGPLHRRLKGTLPY